jgi:hypothetical protein
MGAPIGFRLVDCGAQWRALEAAQFMVERHHYLRSRVDQRCRPFAYLVEIGGDILGCLIFGRTQSTACFSGELTYGSAADVGAGRARFDRWEVLNLARVWLDPAVQPGGRLHRPGVLPGFVDRRGRFRSTFASAVIRDSLRSIGFNYLTQHPPCFVEQPYAIRAVLSYCDTRLHRGVIYRASGFRLARCNGDGLETWWSPHVAPLTGGEDVRVRELAAVHPRSVRIRNAGRSLFG